MQSWFGRPYSHFFFFFQAEDGIRDVAVTGVQTCALPISTTIIAPAMRPAMSWIHELSVLPPVASSSAVCADAMPKSEPVRTAAAAKTLTRKPIPCSTKTPAMSRRNQVLDAIEWYFALVAPPIRRSRLGL